MAFKKSIVNNYIKKFNDFDEAKAVFIDKSESIDDRIEALDLILRKKEIHFVLKMLSKLFKEHNVKEHPLIDYAFTNFGLKPKGEKDFNEVFNMLKSDNAYLRNTAIKFLQEYGKEAKPFIEKLLNNSDKDMRIFAINILGDVNYEDSLDLLRYIIMKEKDINVLMTAVDYLGEIGEERDIALLEALKEEFKDEEYVAFGINLAIERIRA